MQKLELAWIGKGQEPAVEPRILLHHPSRDYGESDSDNMLIHGDNLLALKALELEYSGKVKCIYIDPPFNTGSRIDADGNEVGYEDGLEHSTWLTMMSARIQLLHKLLSDDGALFLHLDDVETDYCKIILDEIFGRKNFMNRITVDARSPSAFSTVNPGLYKSSEYILFYAKNRSSLVENRVRVERTPDYAYDKFMVNIEANYKEWRYTSTFDAFADKYTDTDFRNPKQLIQAYSKFVVENANRIFRFTSISDSGAGSATVNLKQESLRSPDEYFRLEREKYDDIFILNGQQISFYDKNIHEIDGKECITTMLTDIWDDIAWEGIANEGGVRFKKGKKPERLIKRCLELVTQPGDLVLDSFLGSGTTAAVAHKMGRRYIGIELGDHCYTHCIPRLQKVIDGERGGISKAVNWQGGGGFKFYELAPTLIVIDRYGQPVFNEQYNAQMLVAAVAKLNGYLYRPDPQVFWKQAEGQDKSYLFVTTQYLSVQQLDAIESELTNDERLMVCATAFDTGLNKRYGNIEVRKIPQTVLDKCEYGANNYNLNIVHPPELSKEDWEDA